MKLRVLIVHHPWSTFGGAERVALTLLRGLLESGVEAELLAGPGFDWGEASRILGIAVPRGRVRVAPVPGGVVDRLLSLLGRRGAQARGLVEAARVSGLLEELSRDPGVVVVETRLSLPLPADVVYMQYAAALWRPGGRGPHWLAYRMLVGLLERRLGLPWGRGPGVLVANSSWTARLAYRIHRRLAVVVNPPVDTRGVPVTDGSERLALAVSRYAPSKMVHRLLETGLGAIGYRLVIVGGARTPVERRYYEHVRGLASQAGWAEALHNLPRGELLRLMAVARYYVHPPFPEHFGIAVAEAMAAGLVPIVYCGGGAWSDLVEPSGAGACYREPREIPGIIERLEPRWEQLSMRARAYMRARRDLTPEGFTERMLGIIREVHRVKAGA